MKTLALLLLLASPALAQSEIDKLRVENLRLKIEISRRNFYDYSAELDALVAKLEKEKAEKQKAEKSKAE